ncbi:MAG: hypothetical protein ACOY3I_02315 [Verrucomicrobiota bacterium]
MTLILLGFASCVFAKPSVQVVLYHGLNDGVKNDVLANHPLRKSLNLLIGYRNYQKIGEAVCEPHASYDQWLLPSKVFFLRVNKIHPKKVRLELFQEKKSIIQSEFPLPRKKPLIITGPLYGNGRLVLVIEGFKN